jgi:rSAM/selenodomain-associated transferase 2
MPLSIVIPVLNEANEIAACLRALAPLRAQGAEVIVADGGSSDATAERAAPFADALLRCERGRARQMNAGALHANNAILLFLHADSRLPPNAARTILDSLARTGCRWGHFDVRLSGVRPVFRIVEFMMNWRSRVTGIATGDQGIFVERALFASVGGFPSIALMEDIALSRLLKRHGAPLCLRERIVSSSRRWERDGAGRTIWLMWRLRLAYWLGADPRRLARAYYPQSAKEQ